LGNATVNEEVLNRVPPALRDALRGYAELVRQLAADNLAGLTVFGEVLRPEFDTSNAAVSSVLVLQRDDLAILRRLAEHGPALGRRRIAAPLVMTPAYIAASLDTFPLELLEIHLRHATLCGQDHFAELSFQPEHVRLQCEREFKRILIQLRQALLTAAGREKVLGETVLDAGPHVLRTLRGLLWLKGAKDWRPNDALLTDVERLAGQSLGGIRGAIHAHGQRGWADFAALYEDVEKLAAVADGLQAADA
jgi:hypothetical protein